MAQPEPATLLYLVKQLELAVSNSIDSAVNPIGLTTTQYTALTVLERHPGMTAAALARASFVRAQTAASLVSALERRGLIERAPDPHSRRQNLISLTTTGRQVISELRTPIQHIEERMLSRLSAEQQAELRSSLQLARHALTSSSSKERAAPEPQTAH